MPLVKFIGVYSKPEFFYLFLYFKRFLVIKNWLLVCVRARLKKNGGIYMNKTIDSKRIARNIKEIRLLNHLTQVEMGDVLGYSERQIRRLETEGTYDIGVVNLIAMTFDISAWDILVSRVS
jgi:DNA-binding XRE family transcriptional regulator